MLESYKSTTASTNELYLNTYANNLLKSVTETSILNVLGHDFKNGCPEKLTVNDPLFNATSYYHFFMTNCSGCKNCTVIDTKDTNASFLVTVVVKSIVPGINIKKVKTTLQNP